MSGLLGRWAGWLVERMLGLIERRWLGFHLAWFCQLWLVIDTLDKGVMDRITVRCIGTAATATPLQTKCPARVVDTI